MQIAVVTDEISNDLESAIELATSWGINNIEIRGVGSQRIGQLDPFWNEQVVRLVNQSGVKLVAISPGLFKIPLPGNYSELGSLLAWQAEAEFHQQQQLRAQMDFHLKTLLPNCLTLAERLNINKIISFSFLKPAISIDSVPQIVLDYLGEAAKQAEKSGVILAIENEHVCWLDTALHTKQIIELIGSPALKINWDPANAYLAGEESILSGYHLIKDLVAHIHFKDIKTDDATGEKICTVYGELPWNQQIASLKESGYRGYISIETHSLPKIKSTRESLERLHKLIG